MYVSWNQSSSCATRSVVICYALAHKYEFDANLLREGQNKMILSLPSNATDYESAVLREAHTSSMIACDWRSSDQTVQRKCIDVAFVDPLRS